MLPWLGYQLELLCIRVCCRTMEIWVIMWTWRVLLRRGDSEGKSSILADISAKHIRFTNIVSHRAATDMSNKINHQMSTLIQIPLRCGSSTELYGSCPGGTLRRISWISTHNSTKTSWVLEILLYSVLPWLGHPTWAIVHWHVLYNAGKKNFQAAWSKSCSGGGTKSENQAYLRIARQTLFDL